MDADLIPERSEHAAAIDAVLDRAFGPGRFAKTSERVRERGAQAAPELTRVAVREGAVIGVCRMWRVGVGAADALFLGPLAVDPAAQHAGVGAELVSACVAAARETSAAAIICVGSAPFFAPMGFVRADPARIVMPGPVDATRFLGLALGLDGLTALAGAVGAPR